MKRWFSCFLALILLFSAVFVSAEETAPKRGGVTVFDIPIEDDNFDTAPINNGKSEDTPAKSESRQEKSEETLEDIINQVKSLL